LTSVNFNITDIDSDYNSTSYTFTDIQYGQFECSTAPGTAITSCTQRQITSSEVQFAHDGGEQAPACQIMVSDGCLRTSFIPVTIDFVNINDAPTVIKNDLMLKDGETISVTPSNIKITDPDNEEFEYFIEDIQHGHFELTSPLTVITSFTQSQLDSGIIQFVHDSSNEKPVYAITATDGYANSTASPVIVTFNYRPEFVHNQVTIINPGEVILITSDELSAIDREGINALMFTVVNSQACYFQLAGVGKVSTFSQDLITSGENIYFVHENQDLCPSYSIHVSDGVLTRQQAANVNCSFINTSTSSAIASKSNSRFFSPSSPATDHLSNPSVDNGKNNAWIGIVTGLLGGVLFVGCLTGGGILYWRWKKQLAEETDIDLEELEYVDNEPVPLIKRSELQFGKELGRGAAGTVFKGTWKGSEVAIKQLPLYMTEYDPQLLAEFKKETTVMCKLRHPNIVQFFGLYRDQEHYCIVMEYMSRGSLDRLLYNPQIDLPWRPVRWRIIRDITYGLWYLHDQQPPLLHRDLKSPNILLDEQLRAKITDFGVAKITEDATKTMTKGIGTLCWMAPEVMRGAEATGKNYSNKADIYSYGMILWELAARELPYKDLNQFEIPRRVSEGERPEIPQDCPQPLAHLIRWCWHANPDIRPVMPDAKRALDDIKESRDDNLIQFDSTSTSTMVY